MPRNDWRHVADLPSVRRDVSTEYRMAIVENDRGFAVEVQKYHHDRREGAWFKSGAGLTVYASRIPAVIAALEGAHRTITSLERAKRQVA